MVTDRSFSQKCDGARPRCTTCQRARTVQECIYGLADLPQQKPSSSKSPPPPRTSAYQTSLHDRASGISPSKIGPPIPSFPVQVPAPQPPTNKALVRGSVPVHYQFVHMPVRPTLYTLPFRLADIINPTALPVSDSTTTELSMKLCVPYKRIERTSDFIPVASLRYPIDCNWASH